MSDLDEKLKEIAENIVAATLGMARPMTDSGVTADYVSLIKQAFIDAGWRQGQGPYYDAMLDTIKKESGLMTGQEWYDRFERAVNTDKIFKVHADRERQIELNHESYLGAAKKAAGIE